MGDPDDAHRVTVKFRDALRARAMADGKISLDAAQVPPGLAGAIARHQLRFRECLCTPPAKLEAMMRRACERTGCAQPDLLGIHTVFEGESGRALDIARDLARIPSIEWVSLVPIDRPPPPPADIPPVTPDLEPNQGFRNPDPGIDVDAAWAAGARGQGVRITDVEYGFVNTHEDLVDAGIVDISTGAAHISVSLFEYDEHGTATLGVLAAPDNGYGVTGIAPDADHYFVAEWLTTGWDRPSAVAHALVNSGPGDVVLIEAQSDFGTPGGKFGPAELDPAVYDLVTTGVNAGVIVIEPAGNGGLDLDDSAMAYFNTRPDSGAIIVGAGTNTAAHNKSAFSCYGSRVDVQAWGSMVLTTGYGSYANYGLDQNQTYHQFNGTSSASALV
ncbi:MAG: S8 family serine peptidase, partial [Akkermansiaceae bacterium]|nr:S8 family serine peptidase [Akkermansiaceae bacterium]